MSLAPVLGVVSSTLVTAGAAVLVASGCGVEPRPRAAADTAGGSCADLIRREGRIYEGIAVNRRRALPGRTGTYAVESYGCGRTRRFRLPGLEGVPPQAALSQMDGRILYLPEGVLTLFASAAHPLHSALRLPGGRQRLRGSRPCRRISAVRGRVERFGRHQRTDRFKLRTSSTTAVIGVEAATRIRGGGPAPSLEPGDGILVTGSWCRSKLLVADRIDIVR